MLVPGGPGASHEYMAQLAERLAALGRPVLVYDPLGSGDSDRPGGITWTLELYEDELEQLLAHVGVTALHMLGSSSGGMVGVRYAARRPAGLRSLILSSSPISVPEYRAGIMELLEELPAHVRDPLKAYETRPVTTPAFVAAWDYFRRQHICRVPMPPELARAVQRMNGAAFRAMKGDLLRYVGSLKDFDATPLLGAIDVPVLITAGRHDCLRLTICERWASALRDGRLIVFEDSSHMPYVEEPAAYATAIAAYLDEVEARSRGDEAAGGCTVPG